MMGLTSSDWFLEAEIMFRVQYLRLMVIEIDVPGHLRKGGPSSVGRRTILEFSRSIIRYRMGGPWREWRWRVSGTAIQAVHAQIYRWIFRTVCRSKSRPRSIGAATQRKNSKSLRISTTE
jgi:hypothetical protein